MSALKEDSKLYTTGEIAKLCGVSVRTVQYYDTRNILSPSAFSEGGRRLYSEADLKRMNIICFLRDAGLPLNSIGDLLTEQEPRIVIDLMLEQQEKELHREIAECREKLDILEGIKRELKSIEHFSVETIGDIAYVMEKRKLMRKLHATLLITAIPLAIIQWTTIIYGIVTGIWWPILIYVLVAIPYSMWVSRFYFDRVEYICPHCHEVFRPAIKDALLANHTPTLRKLTCVHCGYKGFCVETYRSAKTPPN